MQHPDYRASHTTASFCPTLLKQPAVLFTPATSINIHIRLRIYTQRLRVIKSTFQYDHIWQNFTFHHFKVFVVGPLADGDWLCLSCRITEVPSLHNTAMLSTKPAKASTREAFKKADIFQNKDEQNPLEMKKIFTQMSEVRL